MNAYADADKVKKFIISGTDVYRIVFFISISI